VKTSRICVGLVLASSLVAAGCSPAPAAVTTTPPGLDAAVSGTLTALAPSPVPATSTPAPPPSPTYWTCFTCGGDQVWQLGPGGPRQVPLPHAMGQYYGYSSQSHQILMAGTFADHGAGPGTVAVSDLSVMDLDTGEVTQLVPDNVVEAAWAPDGQALAYILATPATYELHWRTDEGQDRLLADDVSFTWSISPSGQWVAFTRESGYHLNSAPGLFAASVAGGEIVQLSDADKGGTGGLGDRPVWSPDSQLVLLSLWGGPEARLIVARADGSLSYDVGPDPAAADAWWSGTQIQGALWFPDGQHLLLNSTDINPDMGAAMGGPTALVVYRLDPQTRTLADGRLVGEIDGLIDWEVPGSSVWILGGGNEVSRYTLPGG
jgi:dipeptidyl aminopeptidase/acylaminoacyl peptidase